MKGVEQRVLTSVPVLVASIAAIVVVSFSASYVAMWQLWQLSDFRHGLLVFPISVFLFWKSRQALERVTPRPDWVGFVIVAFLCIAWMVAQFTGVQGFDHLVALALVPAAVLAFAGRRVLLALQFPLFFLLFSAPIGDTLVPVLMLVTADISAFLLQVTGVPFFRDGQLITMPGGVFEVADVCSGLRYVTTGAMIALLFGHLSFSRGWHSLIFTIICVAALVIVNGVRAFLVMVIASASEMKYLAGPEHVFFGWLLFGAVLLLLLWVGSRYADPEKALSRDYRPSGESSDRRLLAVIAILALLMLAATVKPLRAEFGVIGGVLSAAAPFGVLGLVLWSMHRLSSPSTNRSLSNSAGVRKDVGAICIVSLSTIFLAGTPVLAERLIGSLASSVSGGVSHPSLPCKVMGDWRYSFRPSFTTSDASIAAEVGCAQGNASIYWAGYLTSTQTRELANSENYVVPPEFEEYVVSRSSHRLGGNEDGEVAELVIEKDMRPLRVWYWYTVAERYFASRGMAQWAQLWATLRLRPDGGSITVIALDASDDPEADRKRLMSLFAELEQAQ